MEQLKAMIVPITGSCLCGELTYLCSKPPVWSVNCHCKSCQKLSGAPFVSAFSVPSEAFQIKTGKTVAFSRMSESGHSVSTFHCAACGTRVCAQSEGNKSLMNVFAPTLEDTSGYEPISNVYLSESASWIVPDEKSFNFEKMPSF
tara:strand:- start:841 stop:1275 length:435 start_codon:yes stop_codon:yes gene_type:complete